MRILIVHHGLLPADDRPTTGGALRAWHHGRALLEAGHEVHWLTRAQDAPGGFATPADLVRRARALRPDRIVCVQPEEAPALATLGVPMAVDLYAPRLLEAPFEGTLAREAMHTLRALAAGDVFLASNPRQRWSWLGVLALAGVDVRTDPVLLVPLVAPEGPRRRIPRTLHLVAGGAAWPWQDPRPALERVLAWMDRRGEGRVTWYGGAPLIGESGPEGAWTLPEHPRLRVAGWVPRGELLRAYASASAAVDWMAPNPERSVALAFRHADYLGCGLPILTGPDSALADLLGEAGWVGEDVEGILDAVADHPEELRRRSRNARRLARERLSLAACEAPLVRWVEAGTRHPRAEGPLVEAARHEARAREAVARAEAAEERAARAEAEVARKREEVAALTARLQATEGTVERLARAVDEVAGFKREAIAVLGGRSERALRSLAEAEREIAILRADVEKKSAELAAMDELRARLENDLRHLRAEVERLRRRGILRRG